MSIQELFDAVMRMVPAGTDISKIPLEIHSYDFSGEGDILELNEISSVILKDDGTVVVNLGI